MLTLRAMREQGTGGGDPGDPPSDEETRRIMRWLRLAADVLERGGGKKGGEREDADKRGRSAT